MKPLLEVPLLEVKGLAVSFSTSSQKVQVVRGVSFVLHEKEVLGIVGESGSGKSVMARSLIRLLPPESAKIDRGEILYKGKDLLLEKEKEMRHIRGKEIGMVFQDPMTALNPTMRIGKQIIEGYKVHYPAASNQEAKERALLLLQEVGISDAKIRLSQFPHELSGGMRQRVMLAIAIISRPKLLIADEPTTALDVTLQAQILEVIRKIQQEGGMSVMLITHDLSIIARFCDRVLVMYAGKVVENAPVEALFASPKHPYTRGLLQSIPPLDAPAKTPLYCIPGAPPNLSTQRPGCPFAKRCPYAMAQCVERDPQEIEVAPSHWTACFLFEGGV